MTQSLIAKIHIAKKQLCLDDETYRQLLATAANGKSSCKDMAKYELENVLDVLKTKGFKPLKKKSTKRLSPKSGKAKHAEIDKIRAIWITMHKHGFLRDGSEDALDAYTKRMTVRLNKGIGLDAVNWLNPFLASRLLEVLKQWHKREIVKWLEARDITTVIVMTPEGKVEAVIKSYGYKNLVELFEEMRLRVAD